MPQSAIRRVAFHFSAFSVLVDVHFRNTAAERTRQNMLRQFGCAYFVLICTWHFDASSAEDLVYVCVLVHAVPVGVSPVKYKRGQSAAGVQYSCRLAGLGPLEITWRSH